MQGRLNCFIAARDQPEAQITAELSQKAASGECQDAKQLTRFMEAARDHASAWLTAPLNESECQLTSGYFRSRFAF